MGFLNRTGAEIGYKFDKNAIKSFFIIEKVKKYRKCPALGFALKKCRSRHHRNTEIPRAQYSQVPTTGFFFIDTES